MDDGAIQSSVLDEKLLKEADCVVIVTDHDSYDWRFIVDHSKCIVDTRNATRGLSSSQGRIVKL
jgi:UDP-N-acetyl-D-mannosaminuronate dehydrogenase